MVDDISGNARKSAKEAALKGTKVVPLTARERYLIKHALQIAGEDGSIYGGTHDDAGMAKITAEIEAIEAKL